MYMYTTINHAFTYAYLHFAEVVEVQVHTYGNGKGLVTQLKKILYIIMCAGVQ